nr:ATPase [Sphingobium sp. OAS761]
MVMPAQATVEASGEQGFVTLQSVVIDADASTVYGLLASPGRWWSDSHTFSGDSANMTMDLRAGGCFCETLPGAGGPAGSVEHARVVFVQSGKRLRLTGALGPLQTEAVTGALDLALEPVGKSVRVSMTYVVGGYFRSDARALAPLVDHVLGEQLAGLKRAAEAPPS